MERTSFERHDDRELDIAVMREMTSVSRVITTARRVANTVAAQRAVSTLRLAWTQRRDRPWLALVAVPLAMNASGLVQMLWLWPLLLLGAASCTPAWRWSWVLSFQLGVVGTEWAYVGATSLDQWPGQRFITGGTWAFVALFMAIAAKLNRQFQESGRLRRRR